MTGPGTRQNTSMSTARPVSANRPVAGVIWMVITGLNFVAVSAIVKHLGDGIPPAQSAFLRYVLGLVFLIPMIRSIRSANLSRRQIGLFTLRGTTHALAVISWFYAMTRIPLADLTAMNYLNPVYVTILAAIVLKEGLPPRRLAAVFVALFGALVILRPGMREIDPGHIAMLGTAALFAVGYLTAKILATEVSASVVVGMLNIVVTIVLLPFAWAVWVAPDLTDLFWLFLVACFATAGHYSMTYAFAAAPLTVTQPATFLQLVWAVLIGAIIFGEPIDGLVILGGAMILAAVSFITWREALARRQITPATPDTKV